MLDALRSGSRATKLSQAQIEEIKQCSGSTRKIAREFGVSHETIRKVKKGQLAARFWKPTSQEPSHKDVPSVAEAIES